ncbi:hypothetical protein BRD01_08990 [Halobacteriales archaeon QS_8_65_32]|nr:MAG: hypothetical protein BRD01_08990 [Halobacteriales archaeon QS_8_65_32]
MVFGSAAFEARATASASNGERRSREPTSRSGLRPRSRRSVAAFAARRDATEDRRVLRGGERSVERFA